MRARSTASAVAKSAHVSAPFELGALSMVTRGAAISFELTALSMTTRGAAISFELTALSIMKKKLLRGKWGRYASGSTSSPKCRFGL